MKRCWQSSVFGGVNELGGFLTGDEMVTFVDD